MPMSSGLEGIAPWRFQFQERESLRRVPTSLLHLICSFPLAVGENEKITNITGFAPYWTNTNLLKFVNNSHQIPFDAHLNVALVAPVSR